MTDSQTIPKRFPNDSQHTQRNRYDALDKSAPRHHGHQLDGGSLYLYRLFVYHAMETEEVCRERFKIMERKLLRGIAHPAGAISVITGITMLVMNPGYLKMPWMHAKLTFVLGLPDKPRPSDVLPSETDRKSDRVLAQKVSPAKRSADASDDRHRDHGDRKAILTRRLRRPA